MQIFIISNKYSNHQLFISCQLKSRLLKLNIQGSYLCDLLLERFLAKCKIEMNAQKGGHFCILSVFCLLFHLLTHPWSNQHDEEHNAPQSKLKLTVS